MVTAELSGRSYCPECRAVFRGGFLRCPRDGAELVVGDHDPLVGTTLAERYQIESLIGEGGIGRVYRARHVRMSRRYAIKVPFGELAYDLKIRTRFLNEAEATSRLQHPNVIGVVDVGETAEGLLYMAMDLAEGVNLAEVIHRAAPLPKSRILRITEQIAAGLEHAHERGLVHRDLKPENIILVTEDDGRKRVCLVDFGIAILRDGDGNSGRLTTEGIVLGTPHYMSPEQACNQTIDHRTDLFALGLIIYEMLAGVLPYDGSPVEVARKNLGADPPRITQRVPGLVVDPYLQALSFWLMQKRPESRPQTAADVGRTLHLIETDPAAVSAQLQIGGLEEVVDLPAPRGQIRPRTPLPDKLSNEILPAADVAAGPPVATLLPPQPAASSSRAEVLLPYETDRVEAPPSNRRVWVVAVVAALLLVGLVAVLSMGGGGAPATIDAAPQVATVVTPDAGVAAVVAADAAVVVTVVMPDAGVVKTGSGSGSSRRPDSGHKKPGSGSGAVVRVAPDAAVPIVVEAPSKASLTALYQQVGRQLNDLIAGKGEASAVGFKKRYSAIPYLEAVRKPELRADAMKQLRALSKEMPK